MTLRQLEKQRLSIMNAIDFNRIHTAMAALGWTYWDSERKTPGVEQLKEVAASHLDACIRRYMKTPAVKREELQFTCSSGGFYAQIDGGLMSLSFVIESFEFEP